MRLSLSEYGQGLDFDDVFGQVALSETVITLIDKANSVIKRHLKVQRDTLIISNGRLYALGIAGTIRLSKEIELEIVPKLLESSEDKAWRESIFLLAALSKYGSIITDHHIFSDTAYHDSLYDIAGRILAREYMKCKRKPIRQYRRFKYNDYTIEGDIEFDALFEDNSDGITQEKITFDKVNHFNAVIQAAMRIVLPYVKDKSIQNILQQAIQDFGRQTSIAPKRIRVPSRNAEWADVYSLSHDIISGMGVSLYKGSILSPGFIVDTWRIWEWLITQALKSGLGGSFEVKSQVPIDWGIKTTCDRDHKLKVFPDVSVNTKLKESDVLFLVDAKYKTITDNGLGDVDRPDLYESYAFCHATRTRLLLLAYPAFADKCHASGSLKLLSTYRIGQVTILAVKVAFGNLSKPGDLIEFCHRFSNEVLQVVLPFQTS